MDFDLEFNLFNHEFWFFAGKEEIFQHSIQLNAEYYTPVDGELIPTGEIHSVANTEFDLRVPKMMGDIIGSKIFTARSIWLKWADH